MPPTDDTDDVRHIGMPSQKARQLQPDTQEPESTNVDQSPASVMKETQEAVERSSGLPDQRPQQKTERYDPLIHGPEPLDSPEADESILKQEPSLWQRALRGPVVSSLAILIFSIIMLLAVSTVFQFIETVQAAPEPLQWIGYGLVSILLFFICWAIFWLSISYVRRFKTPRIAKADIHSAKHRQFIQAKTKKNVVEGRAILRQILSDYPLRDPRFCQLLTASGCSETALEGLRTEITELIQDRDMPAAAWLTRCNDRVLAIIDTCAQERISSYSYRVGLKTAVMPSGAIDQLIVIFNSLLMLKDLCALYNVKTTPAGTCSVAANIFMNAFVAAKLEGQISEFAPDSVSGLSETADSAATTGADAGTAATSGQSTLAASMEAITGSAGSAVSAVTLGAGKRAAEGLANGYLIRRLGSVCIRYLRPIQP